MKSKDLQEADFREILNDYVLPLFPGAVLGSGVSKTSNNTKKLIVCQDDDSTLLLKTAPDADYRIELKRSQAFSTVERRLIEEFLKALIERDVPSDVAHRRDTLVSVLNEAVSGFVSPEAKRFMAELLTTLAEWAQQTYEGEQVTFSAGIVADSSNETDVTFSDVKGKDCIRVLTNSQDNLLVFTTTGKFVRHDQCSPDATASKIPNRKQPKCFAPIRFDLLAGWTQHRFQDVAVALTRQREILVFRRGELLLAKRRGAWRFFSHDAYISKLAQNTMNKVSQRDLSEALYLTSLDVAFARKGGCLGVFRKDAESIGIKLVAAKDRLKDAGTRNRTTEFLTNVIGKRKFQDLPRELRMELAAIDGSLIVNCKGDVLAVGAILTIESRSESGGGRQAAAESISDSGLGLKISNDGYIRALGARKEIFTIG